MDALCSHNPMQTQKKFRENFKVYVNPGCNTPGIIHKVFEFSQTPLNVCILQVM